MSPLSVAIVGGGPSGLVALNELLNTTEQGISTIGTNAKPTHPAFKVKLFEQNFDVGGVWNAQLTRTDPQVPSFEALNTGKYNDPEILFPGKTIPKFPNSSTRVYTDPDDSVNWSNSPVYSNLYTNIPSKFMRFSYSPYYDSSSIDDKVKPFLYHNQVKEYLKSFVNGYGLQDYIQLGTQVEKVEFVDDRFSVITRRRDNGKDVWEIERFDRVIIAAGHYNIPYFPKTEGFAEYIEKYPDVILHSKAFRNAKEFKNQRVVVVGSSISSIDIIQYIAPVVKDLYISKKPESKSPFEWINEVIGELQVKPRISRFNTDGSIEFEDGSILKNVDKVIFATGYHYHYPFLEDGVLQLTSSVELPSSSTRINDLYLHTFHINNPKLAFVGIPQTSTVFASLESESIAIAGVWSGAKNLPPIKEQLEWIAERLDSSSDSKVFQSYFVTQSQKWFIDPLNQLASKGRKHVFAVDSDSVEKVFEAIQKTEELYRKVKKGEIVF